MQNHIHDREQLLRRYIALKEKAREIESEIESLKSNIFFTISELQDETGEKEIIFEDSVFTIGYRKSYEYPIHIKEMEKELKAAKKEAEASGEASLVADTGYVTLKKK
ncbi:MAG: hypothetical protein SNJ66_08885 [Chloroherpetonaceae bacterium]